MKPVCLLLLMFTGAGGILSAQDIREELWQQESARRLSLLQPPATPGSGEGIDVTSYALDLRIQAAPPFIRGVVTVNASVTATSVAAVTLDLSSSLTVDSVLAEGARVPVSRSAGMMTITLPSAKATGARISLEVAYHGTPDQTTGSIAFASAEGQPWIWTLSEPYGARDWWPCKDHPSDKADSIDLRVTVPSGLKVGSQGVLEGVTINGDGTSTHRWRHRYPISTYLVSLAIGPYREFTNWYRYAPADSMPVLNYVLASRLAEAQAQLPATVRALEIFSDKFGPYPFLREKYGHAQFGWGGGMEHQTMTSMGRFDESLMAHELAHQWYGDCVTLDAWPHLWLNEGFATFAEAVHNEVKHGTPAYRGTMAYWRNRALHAPGSLFLRDTATMTVMFDMRRVYAKGGWVLHMLRGVLGDSAFFAGMKSYVTDTRYRYGTATTERFREVMEAVSSRELRFFFDAWVYGEGYPVYTYGWRWMPAGGGTVTVTLQQSSAGGTFFAMPIRVACYRGGTPAVTTVWNNAAEQSFVIPSAAPPDSVVLDPDSWILRDVQYVGHDILEASLLPHTDLLHPPYPNPLNPHTTVVVDLAERGALSLLIYDMQGREVASLWDGPSPAGIRLFRWNGQGFASGVYLVAMRTASTTAVRKLLLVR